ncbi:phosphopentomutase [Pasteuria penetrans]|uniref:phosphopentomutase n=1 Tax=Pasteuria penetrans TaxID=86005 RepID=UPI000F9EEE35|nr:phosphopentomutase [Pasteuria penetrans]
MGWKRVVVIVLDSVGIGELPDAHLHNSAGSHTLLHTAEYCKGLVLPTLEELGLGCIASFPGVGGVVHPRASYGRLATQSKDTDTMVGHWEMMGVVTRNVFPTYPQGFPEEMLQLLEKRTGKYILRSSNRPASGTTILKELGEEHMRTGKLILYTSAVSSMQIAAHEEIIPPEELYAVCKVARELTRTGPHAVARVIARPFVGTPGSFVRTSRRHDFSLMPPDPTVLDVLHTEGIRVVGIGKIGDIYGNRGLDRICHTSSNQDGMEKLLTLLREEPGGLLFINLVDFDSRYGHRRNPKGYGAALEEFDHFLPNILEQLGSQDLLLITADHGNDPTYKGTDHTREYAPVLCYLPAHPQGYDLGTRTTLADIGATVAETLGVKAPYGTSFLRTALGE